MNGVRPAADTLEIEGDGSAFGMNGARPVAVGFGCSMRTSSAVRLFGNARTFTEIQRRTKLAFPPGRIGIHWFRHTIRESDFLAALDDGLSACAIKLHSLGVDFIRVFINNRVKRPVDITETISSLKLRIESAK